MSEIINERNFMKFNGCALQARLMAKSPGNMYYSRREQADMSRRLLGVQRDMLKSFPNGAVIHGGIQKAACDTRDLIASGESVIYGGVFVYKNASCRTDVIIKNNGSYDLYVVRPTNKYQGLIDEALYARLIMKKNRLRCGRAYVCAVNKEAEGENILALYDAENPKRERKIADRLNLVHTLLRTNPAPEPEICSKCESCSFFRHCFPPSKDSIFSLKSISFKEKAELCRAGIATIDGYLKSGRISEKALREIKVMSSDEDVYDREAIRSFLGQLHYPLGFLDFETAEVFVPTDPILKPMDTVITQFSYHLIEKEGAKPIHFDFIGDGFSYPERDAAKELIRVIGKDHCVLMYSNYEKICIERLMKRLPEYAKALRPIADSLVDLEKPFAKKYLVNRRMEGRSSLKKVLPALYPGDRSLSYEAMNIKNGGQAESVYLRLPKMTEAERKRALKDLRDYCALDTLAMIKLVEKLRFYGEGNVTND